MAWHVHSGQWMGMIVAIYIYCYLHKTNRTNRGMGLAFLANYNEELRDSETPCFGHRSNIYNGKGKLYKNNWPFFILQWLTTTFSNLKNFFFISKIIHSLNNTQQNIHFKIFIFRKKQWTHLVLRKKHFKYQANIL